MLLKKKHKKFDQRMTAFENGFIHPVSIPWDVPWNEACADVMEVFGLPGGRYMTRPLPTAMEIYFKSKKDYDLCQILISEKI